MPLKDSVADRPRWFALAFAVLALNGAVTLAATTIRAEGWMAAAFNLFGISAILWLAGGAGIAVLLAAPAEARPGRGDIVLLVLAAIAALLPFPVMSAAALTCLCLWAIATAPAASPLRRGALIFLSMTTSLLWGRMLLGFGSGPLLGAEGALAGFLAGTGGRGNVVQFAGGGFYYVAPGCSSLQGVSLAIVFWVTVTQYFAVPMRRRVWAALGGAIAVAIGVNLARLTAIALRPADFDTLHTGIGATAFGWAALAGIVAVTWMGTRDALVSST